MSRTFQPDASRPGGNPERIGFWAPAIIVTFIALTLAGTYYVRLHILEKTLSSAMDLDDNATVWELANSFPSPINARDREGSTPLHRAVEWGDVALAELLIAKGADINAKANGGWTPLHSAAWEGQREIAEVLIANGAAINAKETECGRTPLHWAALMGHKEVVEVLIAKGADINAKDNGGVTVLQAVILYSNHDAIAELLRKAGAKE